MAELLSLSDAQMRVLERAQVLGPEVVGVENAAGRILAADARSAVDLPPFASSAMDGFALRAADTPGTLPVVARIAAGFPPPRALAGGETMGIATGGVVPDGADAVIPLEDVVDRDNSVTIAERVEPGANVRERGGDAREGQSIVSSGVRLAPAHLGALAAAGVVEVPCGRRPRVAVLATGSELRPAGEPLGPGEIYDANGLILVAALEAAGAVVERLPTVADDDEAHREALARGLGFDVLITSGGVSVGPHDLVREIARDLGVEEVFWGVAVKPGKPVSFGVRERTLLFGLPGNPVSSLVAFELFVRPAVLALQGASDPLPRFELGRLGRSVRRNPTRDQLSRARSRFDPDAVVLEPLEGQESHMIARAAEADALVFVPRGDGELPASSTVRYLRLA